MPGGSLRTPFLPIFQYCIISRPHSFAFQRSSFLFSPCGEDAIYSSIFSRRIRYLFPWKITRSGWDPANSLSLLTPMLKYSDASVIDSKYLWCTGTNITYSSFTVSVKDYSLFFKKKSTTFDLFYIIFISFFLIMVSGSKTVVNSWISSALCRTYGASRRIIPTL